ncbi:MAG: hypothetical protein J2P53_16525 [Bradyrhizobiaceae bacterium]|nr:hypothetical protein [Bradyrhizobiaceae bacterium]
MSDEATHLAGLAERLRQHAEKPEHHAIKLDLLVAADVVIEHAATLAAYEAGRQDTA